MTDISPEAMLVTARKASERVEAYLKLHKSRVGNFDNPMYFGQAGEEELNLSINDVSLICGAEKVWRYTSEAQAKRIAELEAENANLHQQLHECEVRT